MHQSLVDVATLTGLLALDLHDLATDIVKQRLHRRVIDVGLPELISGLLQLLEHTGALHEIGLARGQQNLQPRPQRCRCNAALPRCPSLGN
ncbi:hypothetical protein OMD46_22725 [Pseudomonas sp. MDMC_285]|nr:hypothetical protein [Pseudomonas sp. MDMC_285]